MRQPILKCYAYDNFVTRFTPSDCLVRDFAQISTTLQESPSNAVPSTLQFCNTAEDIYKNKEQFKRVNDMNLKSNLMQYFINVKSTIKHIPTTKTTWVKKRGKASKFQELVLQTAKLTGKKQLQKKCQTKYTFRLFTVFSPPVINKARFKQQIN